MTSSVLRTFALVGLIAAWAAPTLAHASAWHAGLLCGSLSGLVRSEFVAFANSVEPDVNGALRWAEPRKLGKGCVKNLQLAAAFGVVLASGEACEADAKSFTAAISELLGTPALPVKDEPAGALARFNIPNGARDPGQLVIHRGPPNLEGQADPKSNQISYACVRREGGTQ